SGRALRLRELYLRLHLLEGGARRMALEGALLAPAREPALPELRRRPARPAPPHAVRLPGRGGPLRRRSGPVAATGIRWPRARLPLPGHGRRPALDAHPAAHPGS